jgi:nitrate reductase delta subunit
MKDSNMLALKALAALLAYPERALIDALPEIRAVLDAEPALPRVDKVRLFALANELAVADLLDAQERYVALFDRGRATSLHLFEHVHGDSRDRGQAMVDLKNVYANAGLTLAGNELPDYLPAVLEYLSLRPAAEVREMLADCAHILRKVGEALASRRSAYAAVFAALLDVAKQPALAMEALAAHVSADADNESLDEEWIDPPVLFGLGCGDARSNAPRSGKPRAA